MSNSDSVISGMVFDYKRGSSSALTAVGTWFCVLMTVAAGIALVSFGVHSGYSVYILGLMSLPPLLLLVMLLMSILDMLRARIELRNGTLFEYSSTGKLAGVVRLAEVRNVTKEIVGGNSRLTVWSADSRIVFLDNISNYGHLMGLINGALQGNTAASTAAKE